MPPTIVPADAPEKRAYPQRMWLPYRQAAKYYLGISPDILRAAINSGELPAFRKPLTRGRRPDAKAEHDSYFVSLCDVDTWIRTCWPQPERV